MACIRRGVHCCSSAGSLGNFWSWAHTRSQHQYVSQVLAQTRCRLAVRSSLLQAGFNMRHLENLQKPCGAARQGLSLPFALLQNCWVLHMQTGRQVPGSSIAQSQASCMRAQQASEECMGAGQVATTTEPGCPRLIACSGIKARMRVHAKVQDAYRLCSMQSCMAQVQTPWMQAWQEGDGCTGAGQATTTTGPG